MATTSRTVAALDEHVAECRACPRLVQWREQVAVEKRRAYADETYWGRAVPSFGAHDPRVLIVGLAPGAHGANRTGRMFTGDRSGDWLYAALHRAGLASQPTSVSREDGLELLGTRITAPVHCAPPGNKPTTAERDACRPWLARELQLLWPSLRVVVVLGAFGWAALPTSLRAAGIQVGALPKFGHGVEVEVDGRILIACYHVSQQNTFTGKLTEPMLDAVFTRALMVAGNST
jgi:uracil-DNA glycosylase family 4